MTDTTKHSASDANSRYCFCYRAQQPLSATQHSDKERRVDSTKTTWMFYCQWCLGSGQEAVIPPSPPKF